MTRQEVRFSNLYSLLFFRGIWQFRSGQFRKMDLLEVRRRRTREQGAAAPLSSSFVGSGQPRQGRSPRIARSAHAPHHSHAPAPRSSWLPGSRRADGAVTGTNTVGSAAPERKRAAEDFSAARPLRWWRHSLFADPLPLQREAALELEHRFQHRECPGELQSARPGEALQ